MTDVKVGLYVTLAICIFLIYHTVDYLLWAREKSPEDWGTHRESKRAAAKGCYILRYYRA